MDNMNHEKLAPIDITAALRLFRRQFRRLWWIPVILALLFGARTLIGTVRSYQPMYQTSAILSVSTGDEEGGYSFYADSTATEHVVDTFSYILNSEVMSERLRQTLGGALGGSVRAEFVEGTSLFALIATSSEPQKAVDLINAVIAVYPQVSTPILGNTQLKVIESAPLPAEPYNSISDYSGALSDAAVGALIGLAVIALFALTRSKFLVSSSAMPSQVPTARLTEEKRIKSFSKMVFRIAINAFCEPISAVSQMACRRPSCSLAASKSLHSCSCIRSLLLRTMPRIRVWDTVLKLFSPLLMSVTIFSSLAFPLSSSKASTSGAKGANRASLVCK